MAKLAVSEDTYNEIASLMEKQGREVNKGEEITIKKDDAIMPPYNFRLATIRRDVMQHAGPIYSPPINEAGYSLQDDNKFIDYIDKVFHWVLTGEKPERSKDIGVTKTSPKGGWK